MAKDPSKTQAGKKREAERLALSKIREALLADGHIVEHWLYTNDSPYDAAGSHGEVLLIEIMKPGLTSDLLSTRLKAVFDDRLAAITDLVEAAARTLLEGKETQDISTELPYRRLLAAFSGCVHLGYRYEVNDVESQDRPRPELVNWLMEAKRGLVVVEGDGLHAAILLDVGDRLIFGLWNSGE